MSEAKAKAPGRWIGIPALTCILAALGLQFASSTSEQTRPPLLDWNYATEVKALLDSGRVGDAQAALDAGTLLDPEAVALMKRLPPIPFFDREIARDVALRKRIAIAHASILGGGRHLDNAQRAALGPAASNAEMLALLAPRDARSWFGLGFVYLRRGDDSKMPIDYVKAAKNLQRAVEIQPDLPGAASVLRLATSRSKRP